MQKKKNLNNLIKILAKLDKQNNYKIKIKSQKLH